MQSDQKRQRRKQLKRLKREEKRRALAEAMPVAMRIELLRMLAPERGAQMCMQPDPQMCAEAEGVSIPVPVGDPTFREAVRIARKLLGRRASIAECLELMARTYLTAGPRAPS